MPMWVMPTTHSDIGITNILYSASGITYSYSAIGISRKYTYI